MLSDSLPKGATSLQAPVGICGMARVEPWPWSSLLSPSRLSCSCGSPVPGFFLGASGGPGRRPQDQMVHAILRAWGHNSGQYLCLWRQEGKRDRLLGLDPEKGLTLGAA